MIRFYVVFYLLLIPTIIFANRIPTKFLGWWDVKINNEHFCKFHSPTKVKINPIGIENKTGFHLVSCISNVDDNIIIFETWKSGDGNALPIYYEMERGGRKNIFVLNEFKFYELKMCPRPR
jgi:hypothetical protein